MRRHQELFLDPSAYGDLLDAFQVLSPRSKLTYTAAMLARRPLTLYLESETGLRPVFPFSQGASVAGTYPVSEQGVFLHKYDTLSNLQAAHFLADLLMEIPVGIVVGVSRPHCLPAVPIITILQAIGEGYQPASRKDSRPLSTVPGLAEEIFSTFDEQTQLACLATILKKLPLVVSMCDEVGDCHTVFPIQSAPETIEYSSAVYRFSGLVSGLPTHFRISCLLNLLSQAPLGIAVGAFADDVQGAEMGEFQLYPGRRAGCYVFPSLPVDAVFRAITNAHKASKRPA